MFERTDHVSPETRSAIMRAVKSRGAKSTEKRLRAMLVASGIRGWKMNADHLPGKPDFIFPKEKVVVFADGCFWHGCSRCYRRPHSGQAYWDAKVLGNIARDRRRRGQLRRMGWSVIRLWEHEIISDVFRAVTKLRRVLDRRKMSQVN